MRPRRTFLYVPGSDWRKVEKASGLSADCVCIDLEDGVAPEMKPIARQQTIKALRDLDFGTRERLVRINPVGLAMESDDLGTLVGNPDAIVVPKVAYADQVREVSHRISAHERFIGVKEKSIRLIAQIETAMGLVNLKDIASADERLDALIFGSEDYASDVGAKRTERGEEIFYARSAVVAHAAAFGLQAIDMLWTDFKDRAGLERVAAEGARLGYSGMQIIHPDQIEPVRRAFTPSPEEITAAQRIIDAYQAALHEGRGAFALEGKMVDLPIVKAAERLLARAAVTK